MQVRNRIRWALLILFIILEESEAYLSSKPRCLRLTRIQPLAVENTLAIRRTFTFQCRPFPIPHFVSSQQRTVTHTHAHIHTVHHELTRRSFLSLRVLFSSSSSIDNDNDNNDDPLFSENPYADPMYPNLEFINYDDPEYSSDRSRLDESVSYSNADVGGAATTTDVATSTTEETIESMREERRQQNDEYQFQTYFTNILKNGDVFNGEWTVYKSSAFLPHVSSDAGGVPRLVKASTPLKVTSRAYKILLEEEEEEEKNDRCNGRGGGQEGAEMRTRRRERIIHEELLASGRETNNPYESWEQDLDVDGGFGSHDVNDDDWENHNHNNNNNNDLEDGGYRKTATSLAARDDENEDASEAAAETLIAYWPEQLQKLDFRGEQGIMCVGNAYTISTAVPIHSQQPLHEGPYKEYRAEMGIQCKSLRFRIKLNYAVSDDALRKVTGLENSTSTLMTTPPSLLLKTLVVCREARQWWPRPGKYKSVADRISENGLFGKAGASGGLYDPPPIDEVQAQRYMLLDLEGHASVLFPYQMDQSSDAFNGNGWVSSLDWAPDNMRYQVDRKVNGGKEILGLRTLELSEVQSKDADTYRPKDGGKDMRQ